MASAQTEPTGTTDETPAGYREAVDQALEDLRSGYPGEARGMFARAHELMPSARTLWGLGMAEFELRSYVDSIDHLQQALVSEVRPLNAEQRQQSESLLERARQYVTRLTLQLSPPSAQVELDGAPLTTREALLSAGDHQLEVHAEGYTPQRRTLRGLGGDAQLIALTLSPLPAETMAPPRDERRSLWKNPWLWTGVGVLIAGAAVTGGLLATRDARLEPAYGGSANKNIPGL